MGAKEKAGRFVEWANQFETAMVGAGPPEQYEALVRLLERLIDLMSKENQQAIEEARAALAACLMVDWSELGGGGTRLQAPLSPRPLKPRPCPKRLKPRPLRSISPCLTVCRPHSPATRFASGLAHNPARTQQ